MRPFLGYAVHTQEWNSEKCVPQFPEDSQPNGVLDKIVWTPTWGDRRNHFKYTTSPNDIQLHTDISQQPHKESVHL